MDTSQPDWNIPELYFKAWEVVKKNKILWVLGAAAASGAGYNFRSSNFDSNDFQKLFSPNTSNTPEKISQVLGASTNKPFTDAILNIFMSVPLNIYLLAGLEFLLLIILGLATYTIYQAWSQGMLIQAAATTLANKQATLAETGSKVLPKLKQLLWIFIVPSLILTLAIFVSIFILVLGTAFAPGVTKILFIILAVVAIGAAIYWAIDLSLSLIWAPREIILNHKNGWESLIAGIRITRKKIWPALLLGAANNILAFIVFLIPLLIIGALVAAGVVVGIKSPASIPVLVVGGIFIGLPVLVGFTLLTGIMGGFKAVVWTDAYLKIKGKYDH
jgi:hypothetical protein